MNEIFILLSDDDATFFSKSEPLGIAVNTESEAKKFIKDNICFRGSYKKINVFNTIDDALESIFPGYIERRNKIIEREKLIATPRSFSGS